MTAVTLLSLDVFLSSGGRVYPPMTICNLIECSLPSPVSPGLEDTDNQRNLSFLFFWLKAVIARLSDWVPLAILIDYSFYSCFVT